jgi:hypothetical protein
MAFAQCLHAAGESSDGKLKPGTYAVALGVETEKELRVLADKLGAKDVPIHRVEESTGKYAGQLMALGIAPGPKNLRGKYLSTLPLLRMSDFVEYTQHMTGQEMKRKELRHQIAALKESWWTRTKARWSRSKTITKMPSQQEVK